MRDDTSADAHAALGMVKILYEFDVAGSIAEFERAIALDPNAATAHHWLANHPLAAQVDALRRVLRGEQVYAGAPWEITASRPHGHVQAVSVAMQRLGFAALVTSKSCRERDLVVAMVAARILAPHRMTAALARHSIVVIGCYSG